MGAILQRVPSTLEVTAIPMGAPVDGNSDAPEIACARDKHLRSYSLARLAIRVPDRNISMHHLHCSGCHRLQCVHACGLRLRCHARVPGA